MLVEVKVIFKRYKIIEMEQVIIIPGEEWKEFLNRQSRLESRLSELEENLDEDIKGSAAAARIAGVSVRTLEVERDRPGTLIVYKKVGRSVSYSRQSLKAYRKSKRIPALKVAS